MAISREDPSQLGGTALIGAEGIVMHHHVSTDSADNAPVESLLEAIQR